MNYSIGTTTADENHPSKITRSCMSEAGYRESKVQSGWIRTHLICRSKNLKKLRSRVCKWT